MFENKLMRVEMASSAVYLYKSYNSTVSESYGGYQPIS